jgi:hypothetical protein
MACSRTFNKLLHLPITSLQAGLARNSRRYIMAIVYDMSSGRIQSENRGVSRVNERFDLPEYAPALQEIRETRTEHGQAETYLNHIRELLRKL